MTFSNFRRWWINHQKFLLYSAIIFTSLLAVVRLGDGFHRLLFEDPFNNGAMDLRLRYDEVQQWFDGISVYTERSRTAGYPPASYIILWPLLNPFSWNMTRWLWAVMLSGMMSWLIYLILKESRVKNTLARITLTLFVIAMYPTVITLGNGQLTLFIIPCILAGIILIRRQGSGWKQDLCVAFLLLFSLLKPNISVPFFWIVMIYSNFLRIFTFVVIGYGILTFWAAYFQQETCLALISQWLHNPSIVKPLGGYGNYGNVHAWLLALGFGAWKMPASLCILLALGLWIYYYRHANLWLLLGVTGIVARMWAYHRLYDDLLILLPMITLLRIVKQEANDNHCGVIAGILFFCSWLALLAPGTLLLLPFPYGTLFRVGQVLLWISISIFLLYQTTQENKHRIHSRGSLQNNS